MTSKEILLDQFTSNYDTNGWFVALKNTLNNLSAENAAWKPDGVDNSIWEILAHLNYYNFAYLERFKDVDYVYPAEDNKATFASGASEEDWQAEIEKFNSIMNEWRNALNAAAEDKFGESVSAKNQTSWAEIIGLINTHNAHHGGQIVILRKLQGSWDASKGVS